MNVWTWSGKFFGYITNDDLYTYRGKHVGKLSGDEVYGADGRYLGELKNKRLIVNRSKQHRKATRFTPRNGSGTTKYVNYVGYAMYMGYQDFPQWDTF